MTMVSGYSYAGRKFMNCTHAWFTHSTAAIVQFSRSLSRNQAVKNASIVIGSRAGALTVRKGEK